VLQLSFVAIVSVVLFEALAGIATNSLVILSDAAHASFDALTTLILLVTAGWALKPPDEEHTYGHEKVEYIGGLLGGVTLVSIAVILLQESITRLLFGGEGPRKEIIGFIAIGYTLCIDFFRVGLLAKTGESGGVTVRANLYHSLGDMASTLVALLGFYFAAALGLAQLDAVGSFTLSIVLIYLGTKLVWTTAIELSDIMPRRIMEKIQETIETTPGVLEYKEIRARRVGMNYYIDSTVVVSKHVDIEEAHDISAKIERTITDLLKKATITIHIEPSDEETSLDTKIKKIVGSTRDIKGIHNLSIVYANGILRITFHAQVHGGLSLEEGHRITEKVENELQRELGGSPKITVHIEPFDHFKLTNKVVAEAQLERAILKVLGGRSMARLKSIATYVSGQRRYVNVDLILDSKSSVEETHEIVTDVERELQRIFDNTTVTVHAEPRMDD